MQGIRYLSTLSTILVAVSAAPLGSRQSRDFQRSHYRMPMNNFFHHGTALTMYYHATETSVPTGAATQTTVVVATPPSPTGAAAVSTPVDTPKPSTMSQAPASPQALTPAVPAVVAPSIQVTSPVTSKPSTSTVVSVQSAAPAVASPAVAAQAPTTNSNVGTTTDSSGNTLSADIIKAIMPSSASCAGAPFPAECLTAAQAAPLLSQSFSKYSITSKPAQAAILALIALESGELKYNRAHYGDVVAGKGTRNMQSPTFNVKYATNVLGSNAVAGKDAGTVLGLLLADSSLDVGSAAWFLATQCPSVLTQFATNPSAAWSAYLGPGCIGTTETAQRDGYWTAAKTALGVSA